MGKHPRVMGSRRINGEIKKAGKKVDESARTQQEGKPSEKLEFGMSEREREVMRSNYEREGK